LQAPGGQGSNIFGGPEDGSIPQSQSITGSRRGGAHQPPGASGNEVAAVMSSMQGVNIEDPFDGVGVSVPQRRTRAAVHDPSMFVAAAGHGCVSSQSLGCALLMCLADVRNVMEPSQELPPQSSSRPHSAHNQQMASNIFAVGAEEVHHKNSRGAVHVAVYRVAASSLAPLLAQADPLTRTLFQTVCHLRLLTCSTKQTPRSPP